MGQVERSCFTLDLGAIRRNAEILLRAAGGAELWAVVKAEGYGHGAVDVSKAALDAGATALCVATLPEALHLRAALRNARIVVMGPVSEREIGEARGRPPRARRGGRPDPGRREGSPQARHRDGTLGAVRAARTDARRRRCHEPSRLRRGGSRVHAAAGRPLPRGHGAARIAHPAPGQQRRDPALRGGALRRRALWHRALRDLAVRGRPRGRGADACASLGVVRRPRQAARAGGEHRLRAALRRRSRHAGSASFPSGTPTASGAT